MSIRLPGGSCCAPERRWSWPSRSPSRISLLPWPAWRVAAMRRSALPPATASPPSTGPPPCSSAMATASVSSTCWPILRCPAPAPARSSPGRPHPSGTRPAPWPRGPPMTASCSSSPTRRPRSTSPRSSIRTGWACRAARSSRVIPLPWCRATSPRRLCAPTPQATRSSVGWRPPTSRACRVCPSTTAQSSGWRASR